MKRYSGLFLFLVITLVICVAGVSYGVVPAVKAEEPSGSSLCLMSSAGSSPAAPSNLTAVVISPTQVDVSWSDNSDNETGFEVVRFNPDGTTNNFQIPGNNSSQVTWNDQFNFAPGQVYSYQVKAYNSYGSSAYSQPAVVITPTSNPSLSQPPDAPSGLTATASGTSIILNWIDNSTNEDNFLMVRKEGNGLWLPMQSVILGPNTTSYTDTGLSPGSTYSYKVWATNVFGDSSESNEVNATISATTSPPPATPPSAPTGSAPPSPSDLKATSLSPEEVELSWTDNSATEDGFIIERNSGTGFAKVGDTGVNICVFIDTGLKSGTSYTYRIKAHNSEGESQYSNNSTVETMTTFPVPQPPVPEDSGKTIVLRFIIDSRESFVNDQFRQIDAAPVILEGRTLLPIRYVAEPLNAAIGWDAGDKKASVTMGTKVVEMWIGKNKAVVDGREEMIDPNNPKVVPVIIPPGRTMLPLRFVSETLGCEVDWDSKTKTVTVTYGGTSAP